jgi:hypothetical protein
MKKIYGHHAFYFVGVFQTLVMNNSYLQRNSGIFPTSKTKVAIKISTIEIYSN